MSDDTNVPVLDVRPDLAEGREPFSRIMATALSVAPGGSFLLIAPFEPYPLFRVLRSLGFSHQGEWLGTEGFRVVFTRDAADAGSTL